MRRNDLLLLVGVWVALFTIVSQPLSRALACGIAAVLLRNKGTHYHMLSSSNSRLLVASVLIRIESNSPLK